MTGGVSAILGAVGDNFAAGMTGGMAFVYDEDGRFAQRVNPDSVLHHRIETAHWEAVLKRLLRDHVAETQSRYAEQLLADWPRTLPRFWQIVPREMIGRLAQPTRAPAAAE